MHVVHILHFSEIVFQSLSFHIHMCVWFMDERVSASIYSVHHTCVIAMWMCVVMNSRINFLSAKLFRSEMYGMEQRKCFASVFLFCLLAVLFFSGRSSFFLSFGDDSLVFTIRTKINGKMTFRVTAVWCWYL